MNPTETLQKCVSDRKKTPYPIKGSNFVSPKNTKHPEPSTGPKKELPENHVYQKMQPRNHGIKTCNQKPCQQNMQSKTMPAKDAIKNCAIKISNHKTCHQKMQSKNMPSKHVIKKHAICGWV